MGVGNLLGKLFGSDANKNETVLRAYGKLPMYAEYRRLEVTPGLPTAYSQWLDAGRLAWCNAPSRTDSGTTRTTRLLIGLPDHREAIVATVWDGRDSLGRIFPFSFFAVCPLDALGDTLLRRWVSAMSLHQQFETLYQELSRIGQGGDFYKLFQKRILPIRPENLEEGVNWLTQQGRELLATDWFTQAIGGEPDDAGAWFSGLLRRVERWNTQSGNDLALSCPIAPRASFDGQLAAWLQLLEGMNKRSGKPLWVIMPASNATEPHAINLISRDLLADDFQLMTTNDDRYDFVERLHQPPQASSESHVPPSVPTDGSFFDWLSNHATK